MNILMSRKRSANITEIVEQEIAEKCLFVITYILPIVIILLVFFAIMKIYKIHALMQAQHIINEEQNEKLEILINLHQEEINLLRKLADDKKMTTTNQVLNAPGTTPDLNE